MCGAFAVGRKAVLASRDRCLRSGTIRGLLGPATRRLHRALLIRRVPAGPPPHNGSQWLAIRRGRVVAGVVLSDRLPGHPEVVQWWLSELWVDRWHRRRGVGRRLVNELVAHAERHGIGAIVTAVKRGNPASGALLANAGFAPVSDPKLQMAIDRYYHEFADWPPGSALLLRRDLPTP